MEQAIKAYEAALSVLTEDASPREWASTTVNLGNALAEGTQGHRADYFERAIEAYKGALSVFTREEFPTDWATTQNNLGGAFAGRIKGQRAENLEQAIKAYKAALTVRTRDAFPQDWAASQHNLGNAYLSRIKGQRANNLERATKAYETALSVFTLEASPRDHMRTACKCGRAFLFKREWALASAMYASASEAFLLLFGQGLDEDEARDLIANIGPLFAEAAYVAAEIGKQEIALSLLNEGKARLLALALREQKLDLAPEKQARHVALKTEIRQLIRIAQLEGGIRGMEAINQLRELRRELGRLLKEGGVRSSAGGVMALARVVLPLHGAIVAPIITDVGAKIVIVAAPREEDCSITVLDLPELTNDVLEKLLRGDGTVGATGGWLGAYAIQGLPWQRQEALIDEWRAAVEDIGPKLWILFAGRLDIELQERGVRPGARLTWLPAGALGFLPLGLARDASTGRLFTDIYEVNQAPSLEALVYATQRLVTTSPASLVAVVNPTGDIPKLDLPFAEIEGALVASHFDGDHLISLDKSNATPAAVLAALRGKTYWHFSTHGSFNWKDVRQSAIFLKGKAPLTVGALRETEGSLGRPRLVVLSACETGLYDITHSPDEFVGLPATLMQIGASGVLGTLWQVDDLATALFISKFYDLHIDEGLAPVSALQRAQIWFRQATKAELLAYSKAAAAHAKLNASALTAIEASLKSRRRSSATIFAAIWNTLQEKIANASRDSAPGDENLQSPPFEHPYYWGGFVYTGV
ncbi:MAG TPA: CHAT domain-containing protein [Pseudolabrys sp.]|nr:CHAT domain-containing protein [Pseudolabrys sp.]